MLVLVVVYSFYCAVVNVSVSVQIESCEQLLREKTEDQTSQTQVVTIVGLTKCCSVWTVLISDRVYLLWCMGWELRHFCEFHRVGKNLFNFLIRVYVLIMT